ncbi:MAG: DNA mismatch repair endonuclease MutL [Candidatus Lokiarchaeota archaeon]
MTLKRRKIKRIKNAEKIAAGEVVERPANVVKELIENSIDAGAKEIRVIIKEAGKSLIQVIDDGSGISSEDIEFAFESHTSSKIRTFEDLENLHTLGFRGEALASIATVSHVEITSKIYESPKGTKLIIEGGKILEKGEVTCPFGTDIRVKNLFYNIPARRKFLKSNSTELGHITDIIQRYSLAYPKLHFIYHHNDTSILNRSYSSIFLNNRYIKSDLIFRAIQEAYKNVIMIGRYPFVILFIELDPSQIDFNVHPKKLHIRFEDEDYIYNKIYNIVRNFVEEKFILNEDKYLSKELYDYLEKNKENKGKNQKITSEQFSNKIEGIEDRVREEKRLYQKKGKLEPPYIEKGIQMNLVDEKILNQEGVKNSKFDTSDTYIRNKYIIADNFPKIKLISYTGQLSNNVYIVLEGLDKNDEPGLYILDQHAASERVNKEYFYNLFESNTKSKQKLITPLNIEVSPSENFFLKENMEQIKKLGFDFDHFGGNTFILREVPTIFGKIINASIIKDIIGDITEIGKDKSFSDVKEEVINYLACHRSIRGGENLSLKDIRDLLLDLSQTKDPYHCAHGRPILRFLSFKELDKLFKRT